MIKKNENGKVKNKNRLLITQQEMVLIKNSEEVKNTDIYGNLYDCLDIYTKLSVKDIEQNIVFDDKAKVVLSSVENKTLMMNRIMEEWYSSKDCDISETKINCQLCGSPNKYIFYIHNRNNDSDLHIGSECVKKFPDIVGIKQQQKKLSQIQKQNEERRRKIEFEVLEGDELGFIEEAEEKFKTFEIMLPYDLYNELIDTLKQLNLSKSSYIKSGGNLNRIIEKFDLLKRKYNNLYNEAETYYNKAKNSVLICDRNTSNWLLKNNSILWKRISKNGGMFELETLKKIDLDSFVISKLPLFRGCLNDADIKILDVSKKHIKFSVKNSRYNSPITFFMTIKSFMETIGCYCLTDANYKFSKENIKNISIDKTNNNFVTLYSSVSTFLRQQGYDFIIEDKTNQAYWEQLPSLGKQTKWNKNIHQTSALYKKSSIQVFLETFSHFLLLDESMLENNFGFIKGKMEQGKAWITQREKELNEAIAKEARGLQKQREFIPYQ